MEANIPYDQFVEELLTATGENATREERLNGATNFLSGKLADGACRQRQKPHRSLGMGAMYSMP